MCVSKAETPIQPFILNRADPYIYRHQDGMYYFTASVPEYDRIILRCSGTLAGLGQAEEKVVWRKHESGIMSEHIWAPEIHYINGRWYIYFAAGDVDDIWAIRPYVLECQDVDPLTGTWQELGMMQAADSDEFSFHDFSLDMTVFEHRNEWYCIWAEKVSVGKKISNLYIARMESPNKLATDQVLLASPDYEWERKGFWVNEGAAILKHGNQIFVTYSASSTGADYCVGMLSIDMDDDLLDRNAWKKEKQPVLMTDTEKGVFGPGHNSFVKDKTGKEDIMVYHARPYKYIEGNPLYDPNRHAYLMKVEWEGMTPVFRFENNYISSVSTRIGKIPLERSHEIT